MQKKMEDDAVTGWGWGSIPEGPTNIWAERIPDAMFQHSKGPKTQLIGV